MRGDATIDIPMNAVHHDHPRSDSVTPLRSKESNSRSTSEKRRTFGYRVRKTDSKGQPTGRVRRDGDEDTLNRMGRIYQRVLNFSIITRYLLYVLPIAALLAVPIIVGATAAPNARIGGVPIVYFFSWVLVIWFSLWVSKIVAHFLPAVFQIFAGVVSSGTRKYALLIRALEIPLSLVGWAVCSLCTFVPVMTRNPYNSKNGNSYNAKVNNKYTNDTTHWELVVQQILGAFVVASLLYLIEKFFIQLISKQYHAKQFDARIRENKHNIRLVGLLYDASRAMFPMYCEEFSAEDYTIADQLDLSKAFGGKKHRHHRSGSATPLRLLQDVGRFGDKVTSAFGNVAHEITGKQVFNPNSAHSIVIEALERVRSSEALARRIWMSFVVEGRDALYMEDVVDVLGHDHEAEAQEAFLALDRDGNGDISLEEMILTVSEFGRDRKSIASSMHDVDQAITVLDRMLMVVVFIAVIFVFIAFLNASFVTTLATAGTALLSLSFVFSATAQEILGSCIFLFVKHPFDIGDRVDIGADQYTVDHISLLFTVFRRVAGVKVGQHAQIPNIVLNSMVIENVSRSKAMMEQISLMISFDTTFEDIQSLKNELLNFVTDKDNARDYLPELNVDVLGTSDMTKLELRVEIRHKSNWANESVRASRRAKFMCALVAALRRVPIYAPGGGNEALGSAGNATYSVSIPPDVAKAKASEAAEAKQAKRLDNQKIQNDHDSDKLSPLRSRSNGGQGLSTSQEGAVHDLTSRPLGFDPARDEAWTSSREDTSTLNERPSIDRADREEIRGLLRRESTKGRRKAESAGRQQPGVPTVAEYGTSSNDYANPGSATYAYGQTAYNPPGNRLYNNTASLPQASSGPRPIEMDEMQRSPSEAYRKRSESLNRKPPNTGGASAFNGRPYEGV